MQPREDIDNAAPRRTKEIRENQYQFFISPQAVRLPSEVKTLIDSYLHTTLYLQPSKLLQQVIDITSEKERVELFKDSESNIIKLRNSSINTPSTEYFYKHYNLPPPSKAYSYNLFDLLLELKSHIKRKLNPYQSPYYDSDSESDLELDFENTITTTGEGTWRFSWDITVPESELRFVLSKEDWDIPVHDYYNFLPDYLYFDLNASWIKIHHYHNKQHSFRRIRYLEH